MMISNNQDFTNFISSSDGTASRFDREIVSVIFNGVKSALNLNRDDGITIEDLIPLIETELMNNHIALLKNDLLEIIREVLDFFIQEGDVDIFQDYLDEIEMELKKALWPSVSRLNYPEILDLIIGTIFDEIEKGEAFNQYSMADKLSEDIALDRLTYSELVNISEKALLKLEELNFLV